jgi:S-adenosylmethionine synthetase
VTCEYRMQKGACIPLRVHTIVISIQHSEDIPVEQLRSDLMEHVIKAVVPHQYLDDKTVYHLQPSGKFVIGGPQVGDIVVHFT